MYIYTQGVWRLAFLCMVLVVFPIGLAVTALSGFGHIISQKGGRYHPEAISLHPGERLMIVNDDKDIVHHAYVEASDLTYDSGDQEPGSRAIITFPGRGDFEVLCGIHPKMKLAVHVQ